MNNIKLPLLIAGVVINTFLYGQFITPQKLDSILNAIQNNKLESYKDKTVAASAKQVTTTLPKTGPLNLFPVLYETDGKGLYVTYITLAADASSLQAADKNLQTIYGQLSSVIIKGRKNSLTKLKDTTVVEFARSPADKHYMQWFLYPHIKSTTESYVLLAIKSMSYDLIDKQQEKQIQANIKKDPKAYADLLKIVAAGRQGFENNRFYPFKTWLGNFEFKTDLPIMDFEEASIYTKSEFNKSFAYPYYYASSGKNKQALFEEYINLIETGLPVINKEPVTSGAQGFKYLLKEDGISIIVELYANTVNLLIANTNKEVKIEDPKSQIGLTENGAAFNKLAVKMAEELKKLIFKGITINKGFNEYQSGLKTPFGNFEVSNRFDIPYCDSVFLIAKKNNNNQFLALLFSDASEALLKKATNSAAELLKTEGLNITLKTEQLNKKEGLVIYYKENSVLQLIPSQRQFSIYEKPLYTSGKNPTKPVEVAKQTSTPGNTVVLPTHSFSKLQVGSIKNVLLKITKSASQDFTSVIKKITYNSDERKEYETKICLFTDVTNKTYPTINATITEARDFMGKKEIYFTERFAYKYEEMKALLEEILDKQIWQIVPQKRLGIEKTTVYKSKDCIIELVGTSIDCYMRVGKFYYYYE